MIEQVDLSLVNWSRAQFALTAMYHWVFVPLTLGMTFMIAFMETIYVRTGKEEWKRMTKFWMKLFGINFAIGVASGIILEFEFGTNWSNYSWFVGDIFGAPLAIEGILAFFLESTFIAVMFFGWNKVGKRFHLLSTWLVAFGASLSALWILVANGWMQYPAGMHFNPDTARNEMLNFWDVFLSPMAISKFLHTIFSAYTISAIFIIGVSSWFLLKKREVVFAKKSILVAAIFGLISSMYLANTGDESAYTITQHQPVKLAAMEGLYHGQEGAGLVVFGILKSGYEPGSTESPYHVKFEIPKLLSILGHRDANAFVSGINDLVYGNEKHSILSAEEKIARGKIAINTLQEYNKAKQNNETELAQTIRKKFDPSTPEGKDFIDNYFRYFGYGFLNDPKDILPNIPLTFYSFHIMVVLGFYFILFFIIVLALTWRNKLEKNKWILRLALLTMPLGFIASQAGWIVAEVGRQPWVVQDYLPTVAAVTRIDASAVIVTFILFAILFTVLLTAEIMIMIKQIKKGPNDGGH